MQSNNSTIKQITQEDKEFIKYFSSTKTKKKLDDCLVFYKEKSANTIKDIPAIDIKTNKNSKRIKKQADVEDVINMRWKEYQRKKQNL